jgi:poly(3-hydroxyalkanoate) depolymerase
MTRKADLRTLQVAEQVLRVAMLGPDDGERTLLVFNGIGASLETVAPFAERFRRTRIVTFDVPGVGGSPAPRLPYRLTWLSRLAGRLLDKLDIGAVDVFGVSWGGALAQQFVHDHPERSRTLTLAATSAGFVMVPGDPRMLLKLATPRRYTDPDYMLTVGPDIYGGQLRLDPRRLEEHAAALRTGSSRGYLFQLLAGVGWTSWLWLPRLKLPVLIMMGADDPIVPVVNGRILASRLPDARLEVVDCGHLFILTHPEETAQTIERFLLEAPANRAGRVSAVDLALPSADSLA